MTEEPLRILIIGAHPDDADIKAGGTAAKWCAPGHVVRLVSLTDGRAGHQRDARARAGRVGDGPRRRPPPRSSAPRTRSSTIPTASSTTGWIRAREVIRLIRAFRPDLIITHRSTDYHPDHRFAGLLVQDASYLLTVPAICPDVAAPGADAR